MTLASFLFAPDCSDDADRSERFVRRYDVPSRAALSVDDAALLVRLRGPDVATAHAAFETIFRAHYSAACDYATRLVRDPAEAEDLVQTVFGRILDRRTEMHVTTSVRGYILRAVRREGLHVLRHARVVRAHAEREAAREMVMESQSRYPLLADETLAASELGRVVDKTVAQLPERCREAFTLRWRYEMSYAEIAETMGISVKTVEMQLTRAMKAVRAAVMMVRTADS